MKWILRTPLHGLVSSQYMLISVTGRKTGKIYQTPVQYRQCDQTVTVITQQAYKWWKNLTGGADVQLVIRGKPLQGVAVPSTDPADITAAMRTLYPKSDPAVLLKQFPPSVAIQIRLNSK